MNYHPLLHPMIQIDVRRITNLDQTDQFFLGNGLCVDYHLIKKFSRMIQNSARLLVESQKYPRLTLSQS